MVVNGTGRAKSPGRLVHHQNRLGLMKCNQPMDLGAAVHVPVGKGGCQPACKPGSVGPETGLGRGGHSSGTVVADRLKQPTRTTGLETGLAPARSERLSPLFGFAPGGVYRAVRITASAVRSYRTLSPLPRAGRFAFCGTVPGVTPAGCYPAPCFHGARTFLPERKGSKRPPGRLTI
jgi:hypothetical protein